MQRGILRTSRGIAAALLLFGSSTWAEEKAPNGAAAQAVAPASVPGPAPLPAPASASLESRDDPRLVADRIEALSRGELDVRVDPESLFVVQLEGELGELLSLQKSPQRRPARAEETAEQRLTRVRVEFLARNAADRQRILERHRQRQDVADQEAREAEELRQRLESLEAKAQGLEQLLAGKLPPGTDPGPLVTVELLTSGELGSGSDRTA